MKSLSFIFLWFMTLEIQSAEIEIQHWWISKGEIEAEQVIKKFLEENGHTLRSSPVEDGSGKSSFNVLALRTINHNLPDAVLLKAPDIQKWDDLGLLYKYPNSVLTEKMESSLPSVVLKSIKPNDNIVALPLGIHRTNWLWLNNDIFNREKIPRPNDVYSLLSAAKKLKNAGYIPFSYGKQPWQTTLLFENFAFSILGPEKYQKAFIERNNEALASKEMLEVFIQFKKLNQYVDLDNSVSDWVSASNNFFNNNAAMFVMGDWVKAESSDFTKQLGSSYLCLSFPGTEKAFLYTIDTLAIFNSSNKDTAKTRNDLANIIINPEFQLKFNNKKGSIPARMDIPLVNTDPCTVKSKVDFLAAEKNQSLLPNLGPEATSSYTQAAIQSLIHDFFIDPNFKAEDAAHKLATLLISRR